MKITIYELLGMIKDGKAPKRILYDNYIWSWTGDDYQTILKDEKEQFLITGMYYIWLTEFLNDTVKILEEEPRNIEVCGSWFTKSEYDKLARSEEEKKIPEKLDIKQEKNCKNNWKWKVYGKEHSYNISTPQKIIADKVNEICDYLKSKGE